MGFPRVIFLAALLACLLFNLSAAADSGNHTKDEEADCASIDDLWHYLQAHQMRKQLGQSYKKSWAWCGPNAPVGFAQRMIQLNMSAPQLYGLQQNGIETNTSFKTAGPLLWIILLVVAGTLITVVLGGLYVRSHVQTLIAAMSVREDNAVMIRDL